MEELPRGNRNKNSCKKGKRFVFWLIVIVLIIIVLYSLRSFRRQLEPELVATVRLNPAYFPSGDIYESWHAVYEAYDNYSGTWVHPHEYYQPRSIDAWPEMDLENYTYIITYCQEIASLEYYVFRENNVPVYTGVKKAHMVLKEEITPLTVYIYRIPKMRINNPEI